MTILLEYKYWLIIFTLSWLIAWKYITFLINMNYYLDFASEIKTQFLKLQDIALDYENWWKQKTIWNVFLTTDWKLRNLKNNNLFNKELENPANEIELITWYDEENENFFLAKTSDWLSDLDVNWNWTSWENWDIVYKSNDNKFKLYLLDTQISWSAIKKDIKDLSPWSTNNVNKGWGIDYLLYVYENEEVAKEIYEKYLMQWKLVKVDDWYWIYMLSWIRVPLMEWKNSEMNAEIQNSWPEVCIYGESQIWCYMFN